MTEEQFIVIGGLLLEIRDQLIELNRAAAPEEQPESDECQHERKVSLATLSDPHHWMCPDCGAEYRAVSN